MKDWWLFAILFSCTLSLSFAQNACDLSLSGHVTDEHDGSALSYSSVNLIGENRGASANENGEYILKNLCPRKYQLVISHIGCEPDTFLIDLRKSMVRNFMLEHHVEELREIEVNERKEEIGGVKADYLSKEKLEEGRGKPLGEILSSINGVSSLKTGSNVSKPIISGLRNNRIQIINQGIQLQSQQWGDEHAPEIDPFSASNYTVVRGAGAVKYSGGALGGLVIASPKALPQDAEINGELNALYASNNRMGNTSLLLEGSSKWLPRFAWRVQGSGKRSGNIKTPNYYQKNTGVMEYNGSLDFGYQGEKWNSRFFYSQFNSEIGIFSGAHIGNLTDLQNALEREEPREEDQEGFSYELRRPYQRIIHELTKLEVNWYPVQLGKVNWKLSRQFNIREEFDKESPRNSDLAALNIPEFSLSLESFNSNLSWELPQFKSWKTELGLQWMNQKNEVNSLTDFIPDYTNDMISFYWLEKWQRGRVGFETGFRYDRSQMNVNKLVNREFQQFDHSFDAITLNIGFHYKIMKGQQLQVNVTLAERPPAINELYSEGLHHGSASLEFGDRGLGEERSYAVNASYEFLSTKWEYKLYTYLQRVEDFIYLKPDGFDLTIRGAFPSYEWSNTNALIRGVDQTIGYRFMKHLSMRNEISLLWGNNQKEDNYLINMPSNRIENTISYSIPLKKESNLLKLKGGSQYVFRQDRFNPEEEFDTPPPAYHLMHCSFLYQIELDKDQAIEFGVQIDNLLNTVYRDYLNRFRFFTDEQGRNVTTKIKYNF